MKALEAHFTVHVDPGTKDPAGFAALAPRLMGLAASGESKVPGSLLAQLKADRKDLRQSLIAAFALVAVIGLASVLFQTAAILRPLERLRRDVAQRWDGDEALIVTGPPASFPTRPQHRDGSNSWAWTVSRT